MEHKFISFGQFIAVGIVATILLAAVLPAGLALLVGIVGTIVVSGIFWP